MPPLFAAWWRGVPTILHEQNAVMGRANRALASRVTAIATGFRVLANVNEKVRAKMNFTGNPVRPNVIEAARMPYQARPTSAANCACWCSAAARARASCPKSCRRRSDC